MLAQIIAQAVPPAGGNDTLGQILPWISTFVVGVLGVVVRGHAKKQGIEEGKQRVQIEPQPLNVKMEDHFITRREFDSFKSEIRGDVIEIKGLFQQTMTKIETQSATLTRDIKEMGTGAYNGRQKLWEKVNDQGERLRSVEDRVPPTHKHSA